MMFYDHFDESQIAGIFTLPHFIVLAFYFVLFVVALVLSRKMREETVVRVTFGTAIAVTAMEILKMSLRIAKHSPADQWLPLYFSSLFIYASWLSLSKNRTLRTTGITFMSFGSTTAGVCYAFYPSTSLLRYPIWHPASIHGLLYHWLILYVGALTLWKRFRPEAKNFWHFFVFVTAFTIPAFICNEIWDFNLMFIGKPFALPPLQFLYDASPYLYAAVVYVAQTIALYWVWFGCYKLVRRLETRRHGAPSPDEQTQSA